MFLNFEHFMQGGQKLGSIFILYIAWVIFLNHALIDIQLGR